MIRRLWLLFAQAVTVGLALFLVFRGLSPEVPAPAVLSAAPDLADRLRPPS